jgi:hypothetical protein
MTHGLYWFSVCCYIMCNSSQEFSKNFAFISTSVKPKKYRVFLEIQKIFFPIPTWNKELFVFYTTAHRPFLWGFVIIRKFKYTQYFEPGRIKIKHTVSSYISLKVYYKYENLWFLNTKPPHLKLATQVTETPILMYTRSRVEFSNLYIHHVESLLGSAER